MGRLSICGGGWEQRAAAFVPFVLLGLVLLGVRPVAAAPLDDWRRAVADARRLAENDAPKANARARELERTLPAGADLADQARVLNLLARTEAYVGRVEDAAAHADAAYGVALRAGDRVGQAEADLNVALNTVNQGRLARLPEVTNRALSALEGADRPDLVGDDVHRDACHLPMEDKVHLWAERRARLEDAAA